MEAGSEIVLKQCMGVKEGERVLVVTDDNKMDIGLALYRKAQDMGAEAVISVMKPLQVSGQEPPEQVAAAMLQSDVVIAPTTSSITHTNARLTSARKGTRIATMPGITSQMFTRGPIQADYSRIKDMTLRISGMLSSAEECRIITGGKYELVLDISQRQGVASTGIYRDKGQSGNLPSGEAYIAPREHYASGEFLVDGSIVGVGLIKKPVLLTVREGILVGIEGPYAGDVENAIPDHQLSRTLGELGIGTNPLAELTGIILEDEKIYGSVHIAFGTNTTFGGMIKAPSHIDCVTLNPKVLLDGRIILEGGEFIV